MHNIDVKRTALVTGATGSLGVEIVRRLSASGDYQSIYCCYKSNEPTANSLKSLPLVRLCKVDLASIQYDNLPDSIDVLVNNAAIPASKALTSEVTDEEFHSIMRLNCFVPFQLIRRYINGMVSRKWGRIINIGSIWGQRGSESNLAYTMSKHALSGLTKTVAVEYGKLGVTCNNVSPGPIDSEMINRIFDARSKEFKRPAAELKSEFVNSLRSGRMVSPKEVSDVVCFLATDESSGVNGATITVDVGLTV